VTTVKPALFLAAVFFAWTLAAGRTQSPQRIEVISKRFTYEPDVITLKRGQPVVLVMRSSDVTHGLKVEELNIKSDEIKKDKDTEIEFTPEEVGHYEGQCAHFCGIGHGSMKLEIDVVP
jgi:cytochrome c oxidase subunit II